MGKRTASGIVDSLRKDYDCHDNGHKNNNHGEIEPFPTDEVRSAETAEDGSLTCAPVNMLGAHVWWYASHLV